MLYIQDMFGLSYLRKKFSRTDQYNKFVEKPKHKAQKPSDNKVHLVVINRLRILAEKN